jgi:hypothetical protein
MKALSYAETHEEPVRMIEACVVYHLWRWRNSWNGSESLNYRASDHMASDAEEQALAATLASAKKQAEAWRAPGSVFHIREMPALVAQAGSTRMVFAEVNESEPFDDWAPDRTLLGAPLRVLGLELWQYGLGGWEVGGRIRATLEDQEMAERLTVDRVFRDWKSSPVGARGNQLGWSGKVARTSADAVRGIERAFATVASSSRAGGVE